MANTKPGRKPRVSDDEIFEVFRAASDPVLTTSEVASELSIKKRGTHNRLVSLEKAGEIAMKDVGSRSRVWWLPSASDSSVAASTSEREYRGTERGESPESDDSDDVNEAIEALDLPAEKREAVRAMYRYLSDHGTARKSDFVNELYPDHPADYETEGGWWNKLGKEALASLPGVRKPPEGSPTWKIQK